MQEKLEKAVFSSHFSYIGDVKLLKIFWSHFEV